MSSPWSSNSCKVCAITTDDTLIGNAIKAWRFLYKRGFIEGYGHISARLPGSDRFLIARHSLGLRASADDFLVLDLDGRKLSGHGDAPGEFPIRLEIYRARPWRGRWGCIAQY